MTGPDGHFEHPLPTPRQAVGIALRGFCMGIAEVIPGVSGATVALILGVYRRFVDAIRSYSPASVLALVRALPAASSDRPALVRAARAVHLDFLVPLVGGMGIAIVLASKVIPPLMRAYPAHADAAFFGLIVASVALPWSMIPHKHPLLLAPVALSAALAFVLVALPANAAGAGSLGYVFVCAVIAICAFILPGVSGSYMLKVLGEYEHVLGAIHELDLVLLATFAAGCALGLTTFVRVLSFLLRRFPSTTLAVLTGLMLGSLRSVWPFKAVPGVVASATLPETVGAHELSVIGVAAVGVAIVVGLSFLDRASARGGPGTAA